jgi:hypothetical protein
MTSAKIVLRNAPAGYIVMPNYANIITIVRSGADPPGHDNPKIVAQSRLHEDKLTESISACPQSIA